MVEGKLSWMSLLSPAKVSEAHPECGALGSTVDWEAHRLQTPRTDLKRSNYFQVTWE